MKPKHVPVEKTAHLVMQEMLSELLDYFPGALILVRHGDGGATVVAGGASDPRAPERSQREYDELLRTAPDAIRLYREQAVLPAKEMN